MIPINTSHKRARNIVMAVLGLAFAVAGAHWPSHLQPILMGLNTTIVLGYVVFWFWPDRDRGRFWIGLALATLLHGIFLYRFRIFFPTNILIVLVITLVETVFLALMMFKLLRSSGQDRGKVQSL